MIYDENKKRLTSIAYFDANGVRKTIDRIYTSIANGTMKLVWQKGAYLIVTPTFMWALDYEQMIKVKSNTDWNIE